jgi:hypothetical protein
MDAGALVADDFGAREAVWTVRQAFVQGSDPRRLQASPHAFVAS